MKKYILSKQKNIRDLGGLPGLDNKHIKYGCFYRGGSLHRVDEEDIEILKSMHITDIVDFRGDDEFINQPDVRLPGVTYHNFPAIQEKIRKEDTNHDDGNLLWFIKEGVGGAEHMKQQYINLIKDKKSQDAYKNFFKVLMKDNASVYYHCSQGKDRAGLASYFIETILGVPEEVKVEDYLLSNEAMEIRVERILENLQEKSFFSETYRKNLLDVFAAKLEYLDAAIEVMNNEFNGPINFIKDVLEVDIDKFRKMYLE